MGLFGLFVSLFGLGAMGVDAYKDAMNNLDSQDRAYNNNEPYYTVVKNGKFYHYSTKTGKRCETVVIGDKKLVIDSRTWKTIQDLTEEENEKKTNEYKLNAMYAGEKFYKTARLNRLHWHDDNVYENDYLPGRYFEKYTPQPNKIPYMIGYEYVGDYYMEVEIEYYTDSVGHFRFRKNTKNNDRYLPNGEVLTKEKELKLIEEQAKERAIKNGDAFYTYASVACSRPTLYEITKKVSDGSYWCYVRNVKEKRGYYEYDIKTDYFVPGILKSKEIMRSGGKEPITVYWTEADKSRKKEACFLNGKSTTPYTSKYIIEQELEEIKKAAKEKARKKGQKIYCYYDKEKNNDVYRWVSNDSEVKGLDLYNFIFEQSE